MTKFFFELDKVVQKYLVKLQCVIFLNNLHLLTVHLCTVYITINFCTKQYIVLLFTLTSRYHIMYLNKGEGDRVCSPSTEDEIKKRLVCKQLLNFVCNSTSSYRAVLIRLNVREESKQTKCCLFTILLAPGLNYYVKVM